MMHLYSLLMSVEATHIQLHQVKSLGAPETKQRRKMVNSGLATIQGCIFSTPPVPASSVSEVHTNISPK